LRAYADKDLAEINRWYEAHGEKPTTRNSLSNIGRIEDGVAAGFLYQTDSCVCLLEGFVTNPLASSEDRGKALFQITIQLMAEAKDMGFTTIIAMTKDLNIMERALMHNFKEVGLYHLFSREI
jgi:hypothetical protein